MRSPEGRAWTLKEIVQGKPIGHPSHAMFIHFPVAFWLGALAFDVLSRAGRFPEAPLTASWLIVGAQLMAVPASITGLVDWWGMVPGSSKRRVATRHLLLQVTASALFAVTLALRWGDRAVARAEPAWIALEAAGAIALLAGQFLGGRLVYEMGMRVSTKPAARPARTEEVRPG